MDACVIGPGISRTAEILNALYELVSSCPCPMVLDASALQPWTLEAAKHHTAILTPHLGELERMGVDAKDLVASAQKSNAVLHLKGPMDRIVLPDGSEKDVVGGNAGLTVGGTGDVLAGFTAGFLAQKMRKEEASVFATSVIKRAGEMLMEEHGFAYTAMDVIGVAPRVMRELTTTVKLHD
jgi:ADP-dependent NAD(P)H-hydrate dehydratase / NAD(P)H-hydrate epimerase